MKAKYCCCYCGDNDAVVSVEWKPPFRPEVIPEALKAKPELRFEMCLVALCSIVVVLLSQHLKVGNFT